MKDDSILPCPLLSLAIWTEIVYSLPDLGQFSSWDVCVSIATQKQSFRKERHCLWLLNRPCPLSWDAAYERLRNDSSVLNLALLPSVATHWSNGRYVPQQRISVTQYSKSVRDITEVSLQTAKRELSWLRLLRHLSAAEGELCGNWCLWELKGTPSFAKDQKPWS